MKKIEKLVKKNLFFLLFILISPGFLWICFNFSKVVGDYANIPHYFYGKISSFNNPERLQMIGRLRWANEETNPVVNLISRLFYTKLLIVPDEFFSYLSFFSPRFYFQAGDGSSLSPPGVEPIPVLLFPFWFYGIFLLIKNKRFKPLILVSFFVFLAFVFGKREMSFLWPVLVLYVYISSQGFLAIKNKLLRNSAFTVVFLYGIFIVGRALWLKI